jgi:hypothetical protein
MHCWQTESQYLSVVSLQSLRMIIFISGVNGHEMCAGDMGNSYLKSICDDKVAFVAGPEFTAKAGLVIIIKKAVYGIQTSGSSFGRLLVSVLYNLVSFLPRLMLTFGCVIAKRIGNILQLVLIMCYTLGRIIKKISNPYLILDLN